MRMVFNFRMSVADYRHMLIGRTFGSSRPKQLFYLSSWAVFTVLLVLELAGVLVLGRVIHLCALMVAVALPASFITMELNVAKYKEAYQSGMQAERQIIADDQGLTFCNKTTNESGSNPWSDVTRLEEQKHIFVIRINRHEAVILPKRGMGNGKKVELFRQLASREISDRFYPLGRL